MRTLLKKLPVILLVTGILLASFVTQSMNTFLDEKKSDTTKVKGKYKIITIDNGKKTVKEGTFNDKNFEQELEKMLKELGADKKGGAKSFQFNLNTDDDNLEREINMDLDFDLLKDDDSNHVMKFMMKGFNDDSTQFDFDFDIDMDEFMKDFKIDIRDDKDSSMQFKKVIIINDDTIKIDGFDHDQFRERHEAMMEKFHEKYAKKREEMHEKMEKHFGKMREMNMEEKIDKMDCDKLREAMKDLCENMNERGKSKDEKVIIKIKTVKVEDASKSEKDMIGKNSSTKATKELKIDDFRFYPNPSDGKFNLAFTLIDKSDISIKVLDINGKEIYSETLKDFSGNYDKQINLSESGKGIYLLQIVQGKKQFVKKIAIE